MKKAVTCILAGVVLFALGFWAGRNTSPYRPSREAGREREAGGGEKSGEKVLWSFDDPGQLSEWNLDDGMAAGKARDHATGGKSSVRLDWPAAKGRAPSFRYDGQMVDLSKWRSLTFDAFSPGEKPVMINVKLKSTDHKKQATLNYVIPPGREKTISVRLGTLADQIDLSDVMYFNIFVWEPADPGSLFIDTIRLTEE